MNRPHLTTLRRAVLIALDGISAEGFRAARTPRLDALLAEGALSLSTRCAMPSVTLPNRTSHLTGSGPEQHGATDNAWTMEKHLFRVEQPLCWTGEVPESVFK